MARHYSTIFARGLAGITKDPFGVLTRSGKPLTATRIFLDDSRAHMEALKPDQAAILEATTYANFAKTQELYLQKERETGIPAYNLALFDWFAAPRVMQINVDRWVGAPGQVIRVKARDNVAVMKVSVVIRDVEGMLLEAGEAVQAEAGGAWWNFTTQTAISLTPFPMVKAIAQDLPGNRGSFTIS